MNGNVVDQHFHLPQNARKDFRVPTTTDLFPASESTKSMESFDSILELKV